MKPIDKIQDILLRRIQTINNELNSDFPDDYKKQLGVEEKVFRKIKDILEWHRLTIAEKQESRITTLASMRKSGAVPALIEKQEEAIILVDLIILTLPYIKAINSNSELDKLNDLCQKEIDIIDFSGSHFRAEHVSREEIEGGFKSYFEMVQPYKKDMFKECYEKIEELYLAFKNLHEE